MSNVNEIMRKVEFFQNGCKVVSNENSLSYYRMGKMCYSIKDFDGAEYWWEKGASNHDKKSKDALINLYFHELKHKYSDTQGPIPMSAVRRTRGGNAPSYCWERSPLKSYDLKL